MTIFRELKTVILQFHCHFNNSKCICNHQNQLKTKAKLWQTINDKKKDSLTMNWKTVNQIIQEWNLHFYSEIHNRKNYEMIWSLIPLFWRPRFYNSNHFSKLLFCPLYTKKEAKDPHSFLSTQGPSTKKCLLWTLNQWTAQHLRSSLEYLGHRKPQSCYFSKHGSFFAKNQICKAKNSGKFCLFVMDYAIGLEKDAKHCNQTVKVLYEHETNKIYFESLVVHFINEEEQNTSLLLTNWMSSSSRRPQCFSQPCLFLPEKNWI